MLGGVSAWGSGREQHSDSGAARALMAAAKSPFSVAPEDRELVEHYAIEQLCKDARVKVVGEQESMFGVPSSQQPPAKTRRTRCAAVLASDNPKGNGEFFFPVFAGS